MITRRHVAGALGAAAGIVASGGARAQGRYPDRPIRVVVPYTPGGTNDIVARLYAAKLTEVLGQPVVVENRGGAQGIVGTEAVARAAPDGYTLLMGAPGPLIFNAVTYSRLPYDPRRDLLPIAKLIGVPLLLTVSGNSPYRSLAALIEGAKAHPDAMTYGVSAAPFQFAMEMFNQQAGTRFTYVAYRSTAESGNAVANNEVTATLSEAAPLIAGLEGGRLRALAITSPARLPSLPDVPTMTELGFPAITVEMWCALFAPRGTPQPVLDRLTEAALQVTAAPDLQARFPALSIRAAPAGPDAVREEIDRDIGRWAEVARTANIQLER
ncbi:Bug family tripartite tricarboxylate transporter substrate binding protein [Roseomonas sp. BN140053]|uniref:Bug family tripartite tricarboxylate transporter substrate binding protein n=1 Tax=Roseomonas sp. BN140053 TaxID=3391898 RepID=UPI0039EA3564